MSLWDAVRNGNLVTVQLLLEKGADVNIKNENGDTPLMWASQNGHKEIAALLIEHGAKVDEGGRVNGPKCYSNSLLMFFYFSAGFNQGHKYVYKTGNTPLMWASQNGHKEIAALLIRKGADVNKQNENGETPLDFAAQNGHLETVRLLLDNDAKPNKEQQDNFTNFYKILGFWKAVWMKLVDIRYPKNNYTPLDFAAQNGPKEIAALLIEHGAKVDVNALLIAVLNGHSEVAKLLLEKGADVNIAYKSDNTPLMIAAQKGHKDIVELLLKYGADVEKLNKNDVNALYLASQNGHKEIAALLIRKGDEFDIKNENGVISKMACFQSVEKMPFSNPSDTNKRMRMS